MAIFVRIPTNPQPKNFALKVQMAAMTQILGLPLAFPKQVVEFANTCNITCFYFCFFVELIQLMIVNLVIS